MYQRRRAGRQPLKQEVPLKAGSFCSSLLLLRLKREELCLLSFLTGVWEPGCFPFSSWVVGGTLLLAFLLEFCGNRKNVTTYLSNLRWCGALAMTPTVAAPNWFHTTIQTLCG